MKNEVESKGSRFGDDLIEIFLIGKNNYIKQMKKKVKINGSLNLSEKNLKKMKLKK